MPPIVKVKIERKPCGLAVFGRLTTTVLGSVALMLSVLSCAMSVKRKAGDLFSLMARWNEYTTSSAVSALPLANLAPDFSLKVMSQVAPLSLMSQLCARLGLIVDRSAPSNFTRVSYTLWASRTPLNSYATAGSSEIRSLTSAYQTSVLAAPPADGDGAAVPPPGLAAGAPAAATSSAAAKMIDERRIDIEIWPSPARPVAPETSTGLTRQSPLLCLC